MFVYVFEGNYGTAAVLAGSEDQAWALVARTTPSPDARAYVDLAATIDLSAAEPQVLASYFE